MKNNIKVSRKELKITQGEFARKHGISRKTLSEIENGDHVPSLDLAYSIATDLGVKVEDVFENKYSFNSFFKRSKGKICKNYCIFLAIVYNIISKTKN